MGISPFWRRRAELGRAAWVGLSIMKAKIITYWIATILLCGQMAFAAFAYFTKQPKVMEGFASLGYPEYLPIILGVAKTLGVIALLIPGYPMLKEWAYAGFTFTFVGAIWSHLVMDQNRAAVMPLATLVLLSVSCLMRPASRRVVATHRVVGTQHHPGDLGYPTGLMKP
jgi:hypothetical protein